MWDREWPDQVTQKMKLCFAEFSGSIHVGLVPLCVGLAVAAAIVWFVSRKP